MIIGYSSNRWSIDKFNWKKHWRSGIYRYYCFNIIIRQ